MYVREINVNKMVVKRINKYKILVFELYDDVCLPVLQGILSTCT